MASEQVCVWCDSEAILGRQEGTGRPLTGGELATGGLLPVHAGCRPEMDKLFAGLAAKGIYVDLSYPREEADGE